MRFRAVAGVVVVAALLGTLAASSWGHRGAPSSQLDLNAGTGWFTDQAAGSVSLLDGATASRISEQPVPGAQAHDDLAIVQSGNQSGSGAYVIDHNAGTVSHIDGATLKDEDPTTFSPGGHDSELAVAANDQATWVVGQEGSSAQQVNPSTLAPLGPAQRFSSRGGAPVETPDGSLWAAGAGGYVYSYAAGVARTRTHPATGSYVLVEAENRPVIADPSTGEAVMLDPHSGLASRTVAFNPPGPAPIVTGSGAEPYLTSVDPTHAQLQVTDLNSRQTSGLVVIGNPNARYGPAVVSGNLVFVPSLSQSAVVIAQIEHDQLFVRGQVGVGDDNFGLLAANGSVWFDDPADNVAGVISANLTAWVIPKTGGDGQGHQVAKLGPIPLSNGTSIKPTPPSKPNGLISVHPTPITGSPSSSGGGTTPSGPSGGGSQPGGTTTTTTLAPGTPTPSFTWTPANPQVGQRVTFADTTTGAHRVYQWSFPSGNPSQSTASAPTVTWSQPGAYTVTLVITNNGQSYPIPEQVTISARGATSPTTTTTVPPHRTGTTTTTSTTSTTSTSSTSTSTSTSTTTTTLQCGTPGSHVMFSDSSPNGGAAQFTWVVPNGVTSATFTIYGGDGGGSGGSANVPGGWGAKVTATLGVRPCDTYLVDLGGAGMPGSIPAVGKRGRGGASVDGEGGGPGGDSYNSGGGGAASDIRNNAQPNTPILIAGGGGGGGTLVDIGPAGVGGNGGQNGQGTFGGTAGASSTPAGQAGQLLAPPAANQGGGGGGGGLRGGGGGGAGGVPVGQNTAASGGGGGGTNLVPSGGTVTAQGNGAGNGVATITWTTG